MTRKEMIAYIWKNSDARDANEAELILNRLDFDYELVSYNHKRGYFLHHSIEDCEVQNALNEIQKDL